MSGNRAPTTTWFMRDPTPENYPNGYVRTADNDMVQVIFCEERGQTCGLMLTRKDARLLAKRINQCLDRTVKR